MLARQGSHANGPLTLSAEPSGGAGGQASDISIVVRDFFSPFGAETTIDSETKKTWCTF